jgi:hypothetical protein
MRGPTSTLPPWPARCEADNLLMFEWLNPKLEKLGEQAINGDIEDDEADFEYEYAFMPPEETDIADAINSGIEDAEHGEIEPLRRALVELTKNPKITRFINLPKRPTRARWPVHPARREIFDPDDDDELRFCRSECIRWAADDVVRIRRLWRKHFGKKRRRSSDGWSAVALAARRWDVSESQIENRLKKRRSA